MGKVLWFTGLSGSGKTTIALELKKRLEAQGARVEVIDGDDVRRKLHKHLGFSREDIRENNRLIAEMAKARAHEYDIILIPIISPYREDRATARSIIGDDFCEVFISAPLEECIRRDVKGLYGKALSGEIDNFIGMSESNPYEPPLKPDIEIPTDTMDVRESVERLISFLSEKMEGCQT
jgi:adenylyl-sulfate kinase